MEWLDAVDQPLLLLDGSGTVVHANAALVRLLGTTHPAPVGEPIARRLEGLPPLGAEAAGGEGSWRAADGSAIPVHWSARPLPGAPLRHLLTLADLRDDRELRERLRRVGSALDLVQDFGRIGLWERDLDGMQGRWDRHMYRFWGLPPGDGAPDFAQVVRAVVPEDRQAMRDSVERSHRQPGRHEIRFRVRGADGVLRVLHSQWHVLADRDGRPMRMVGVVSDDSEADARARQADAATAQLALAADLANVAIWRHDLRTNLFYYNAKAWSVLDRPPSDEPLTLDEVRALIHPDDMEHVRASAELALRSTTPVDMRARYRSLHNGWRDVLTRRVVQRDANGDPIAFLGVALDVTEQAERQQRETELSRRLELAASAAGVGIWSAELESGEAHWNEQMLALHAMHAGEPLPDFKGYIARFVPAEHHAELRDALRVLMTRGAGQLDLDLPVIRADGQRRRFSMRVRAQRKGQDVQLVGAMIDVTDRLATDMALRRASERAALAARGAGLGTWELDLASGQGVWDAQMWRLRGLAPGGEAAPDDDARMALVHPDDRARVRHELQQANAEQRASQVEFRVRWPDGHWRWLASRSVPIFEDGRMVRRLGVNWDITDSREAEQARQAELSAQRESQAKSQFLARMSHELRTPLNAVIGFAQLLQTDDARIASGTRRQQLEHIRTAGEHLLALIDDVLDLSSLESGELRLELAPLSLAPVIAATLPLVQGQAQNMQVRLRIGTIEGQVMADATRLRQVVLNVLSNAVKYNRTGGGVRIEAQPEGPWIVLRIVDSGTGMSRDQLRHLFEPFNRLGADRSGVQGTGIGLAIVKANVERMGGKVRVQSRPGVGTRVEVRLVRAEGGALPEAAAPGPTTVVSPAATPRMARLLYIEDNPVNAMIVREIVARHAGLSLTIAETGHEGLAAVAAQQPDLVLVDMQLPDIDGHEVLRHLRADARTRTIPCVALSANAMPEDIRRALEAGFVDYWTKPLDVRAFLAGLQRLLG